MSRLSPLTAATVLALLPGVLWADSAPLSLVTVTEWKAVYGTVEARDRVPARARLGGTLVELSVAEGDIVSAGQEIARIVDDKLELQRAALWAQETALAAQLANAAADLKRGEELLTNGVTTAQRVDALRTQVDVLQGQLGALKAQADVITQQEADGIVLAPAAGTVLDVLATRGAVLMPGETVVIVGAGGTFLRLVVPERHATSLEAGDSIRIAAEDGDRTGTLARIYPLIEGGRVVADVEIADLPARFVGARLLVRLPVGDREALLVPQSMVVTRSGLDFVGLQGGEGVVLRSVVTGPVHDIDGTPMVEVISGLIEGDIVVPAPEAGHE